MVVSIIYDRSYSIQHKEKLNDYCMIEVNTSTVYISCYTHTNIHTNIKHKQAQTLKVDGTASQRCVSKFKIEVRICIPAIQ